MKRDRSGAKYLPPQLEGADCTSTTGQEQNSSHLFAGMFSINTAAPHNLAEVLDVGGAPGRRRAHADMTLLIPEGGALRRDEARRPDPTVRHHVSGTCMFRRPPRGWTRMRTHHPMPGTLTRGRAGLSKTAPAV